MTQIKLITHFYTQHSFFLISWIFLHFSLFTCLTVQSMHSSCFSTQFMHTNFLMPQSQWLILYLQLMLGPLALPPSWFTIFTIPTPAVTVMIFSIFHNFMIILPNAPSILAFPSPLLGANVRLITLARAGNARKRQRTVSQLSCLYCFTQFHKNVGFITQISHIEHS